MESDCQNDVSTNRQTVCLDDVDAYNDDGKGFGDLVCLLAAGLLARLSDRLAFLPAPITDVAGKCCS